MLLAEVVAVSNAVAATRARSAKVALIASCLRAADEAERAIAAAYLSGELRQRRTGVGWGALRDLAGDSTGPSRSLTEVDAAFDRIAAQAGAGSQNRRRIELAALFESAAGEAERRFLAALVAGELRQGALDGVMVDAIAKAAEVPLADVRRAFMLRGSLSAVAAVALTNGLEGLRAITFEVNRPVQPMLASSASSIVEALAQISPAALEWKIDGIRVQMHRDGTVTRIFTRTLDDITDRVPELVAVMDSLPAKSVVLDGEAVALDAHDRPRPFQETAARTSSRVDVEALRSSTPLSVFIFDALYVDGESLIDRPATERQAVVERLVPQRQRTPRIVTDDPGVAADFFAGAIGRGHEGIIVKSLAAPYEAGRRGAGWIKVKPRHTLDLVVLAAEWGHGRRRGWLSNLHLGARDDAGGFVMLGKTFKGMTDEMLRWQTEQFLLLETHRDASTVYVRPELVVEIAFDGVQSSPRYPGRVALRFARVLRYRPDKRAGDADDIDAVRAIHQSAAGTT
jgi:DNA ligase-1